MNVTLETIADAPAKTSWRAIVAKYQTPDRRSTWQVLNTYVPFFLLWGAMAWSLQYSYWITLALAVPAGGLLVRIFIIFHDCGHGSFFKSQRANNLLGALTGVLLWTPYQQWRFDHAVHHASAGNLDRRGVGDVETLTVKEYLARSRWGRLKYRLYRNPIVMFGLGPLFMFLVMQRFPTNGARSRERASVYRTNAALLAKVVVLSLLLGPWNYLLIELPILVIGGTIGIWMFYVQHQFEETYWEEHESWDYAAAALRGSSYYKLPKVLQWFTGNIGLHHIHHLSSRIPNYVLQQCHDENPDFQRVTTITFWSSLKTINLKLWDEEERRLVGFEHLRKVQQAR